jgi:hypothetical protein
LGFKGLKRPNKSGGVITGKILELYHRFPTNLHDVHGDNFISGLQVARLLD